MRDLINIRFLMLLAEFIIHLSEKHNTLPAFKKVLMENGAEFSDSFVENLLRIIQHMRPSLSSGSSNCKSSNPKGETLAERFPGLAIPNEPQKPLGEDDDEDNDDDDSKKDKAEEQDATDKDIVDDLMAQFEADAPSNNQEESKKEEKSRRSRSRERQRRREKQRSKSRERHRSRSRERNRSRSRERNRNRYRDRSRERRRERSRSRRRRSSNDRNRRSRSRERRRSRERNRSRDRDRNRDSSMDRHSRKENVELDDDPVPGKVSNCITSMAIEIFKYRIMFFFALTQIFCYIVICILLKKCFENRLSV